MSKENNNQDFLNNIYLHNSLFWKDGERSELLVHLRVGHSLPSIGASQDGHGVARDAYNFENELGRMFDCASDAVRKVSFDKGEDVASVKDKIQYYLEVQPYSTSLDGKNLNDTLKAFSENRTKEQEAFTAHCVWSNSMRAISMQYARAGKYDVKAMEVYTAYLTDLAQARVKGESLDSVPVPDERLSLLDKLGGKSYTWGVESLKADVLSLTDEQAKKLASQIEAGFPSKETCEFYSKKYNDEAVEYRRQYPSKLQDEMRQDVLNALTIRAVEDALKGKYFDQTGDMSIFMDDKEKAKFEKMSFAEMKDAYGLDLLKTYKGAAMIEVKIAKAKEKGGSALGEALDCLTDLLDKKKNSYYCPDVSDDVTYRMVKGVKKSYQKFGAEDVKFRKFFEAMIPSQHKQNDLDGRVDIVKKILDGQYGKIGEYILKTEGKKVTTERYDRLRAKQLKQKKFAQEMKELSTGKADITKVKATLKARKAAMAKEMVENTGFAANTVLAAHAMEGYGVSPKAAESEKKKISEKRKVSLDKMKERTKEKGK